MIRRRLIYLGLLSVFFGGTGGCSKDPLVAVEGTVTLDGKPVSLAMITFTPESETGASVSGPVDESGRFYILTIDKNGARPGRYKVTLSKTIMVQASPNGMPLPKETMPAHLLNPANSHITIDIPEAGKRDLEITFTSKDKAKG